MNKVWLVATHEFFKHARRVSFIVGTLLFPFMIVAGVVLAGILADSTNRSPSSSGISFTPQELQNEDAPIEIGYVDQASIIITATTDVVTTTRFRAYPDETSAQQALDAEDIAAYYVIPTDYLETGNLTRYADTIQFTANDINDFGHIIRYSLLHHLDPRVAPRLGDLIHLKTVRLEKDGNLAQGRFALIDMADEDGAVMLLPLAFATLLYLSIFASSGLLQNSVIEEKENRMLEILLTSLRPWQLLAGKIIGLGTLGLMQMALWVATGFGIIAYLSVDVSFLQEARLPVYVWVLVLPYYLLGYLVYGGLMAGIGATMTSTRESSMLTSFLMLPIMTPFFLLFPIIDQPDGWVATLLSIIPYTASITMVIRLTLVDVVWWQIALSLVLLAGAVVLSIWAGAKLFRATMLLHGKKLSVREVVRALR